MDVAEYRKKYEEELERDAKEQLSYRAHVDKFKASADNTMAITDASVGAQNSVGLPDEEDVIESVNIIRNKAEEAQLRILALRGISVEIGKSAQLIDMTLDLLRDATEPAELRRTALAVLQMLSFSSPLFTSKRPEYVAALRTIVDDQDAELRQQAMEILAQEKDEYVQRRLVEGLEDPAKALLPPEKAVQLLGYDIHAEYFPFLKEMVKNPPNATAKQEAVRLLAADASSKDLLTEILTDKSEDQEIRRTSAIALQSLAPEEFRGHARGIALDEDESDGLRATSISALDHFDQPESLGMAPALGDTAFDERIAELREKAASEDLRRAAEMYIKRRGALPEAAPAAEPKLEMKVGPEIEPEESTNPLKIVVNVVRSFIKGLRSPDRERRK